MSRILQTIGSSGGQLDCLRKVKKSVIKVGIVAIWPPMYQGQPWDAALAEMKEYWRVNLEEILADCPDLVLVPECSDRPQGLTVEQGMEWYRFRGDQMRDFYSDLARKHRCCFVYSAVRCMADGTFRNSNQFINRDGSVAGVYDKYFPMPDEITKRRIMPGKDPQVIQTEFGKVANAICFDLNFQELLEKYVPQRPDLMVFCSNYHGGLMRQAWAYRLRCHFLGCFADGGASVLNPLGEILAQSSSYHPNLVTTINLDCLVAHLDENRSRLRALKLKYGGAVNIHDPGYLAPVLITSEDPCVTARQMAEEFEIESWHHYYARAVACADKHR
ncbi:MAG: hypothetical protein IJJ33_05370 [Victivallales bacterium]|nr:hypothetical protein [Victivallales bacterium]